MKSAAQRLREEFGSVVGAGPYDGGDELAHILDDPRGTTVDDGLLQPNFTLKRRGGSRRQRGKPKPKSKGDPGRPLIESETRSERSSVKMTLTNASIAEKAKRARANPSTVIAMAYRAIDTGDVTPLLELSAQVRKMV